MRSTLRLAGRNLLRSPRRTVLTTVAIVAGVGFFILGQGFISGITENVIASAIEGTVGHVMARPSGYPAEALQHPVDRLLEIGPEARALLDRRAVAWTERTYLAPIASNGRDSMRVVAIGFDPARDPAVFPRKQWRLRGAYPGDGEVMVSHRIARLLELEPGSTLVLQVRTHAGALNALEVKVSGVLTTTNAALDRFGVFMPAALARSLINTALPSHLSVKLSSREASVAFAAELRAALGAKAEVVTWQDETAELIRIQDVRKRSLALVVLVLVALAAFGIANTILMAAHERVREVGTLRAMGMTERGVLALFLVEGAVLGLVGGILGAAWGGGLVLHWASSPIDFSELMERGAQGAVSVSALVYTHFDAALVAGAILAAIAVATLASIYPARVAARMPPAEAVRAQ